MQVGRHAQVLWVLCYCLAKIKKVVRRRSLVQGPLCNLRYSLQRRKVVGRYRSSRQHLNRFKKGGEFSSYNGHKKRKGVKVHVSVSTEGLPLSIVLSPGNEHDSKRFVEVLDGIRIRNDIGRPRSRPIEVLADAAYDDKEIRLYLRQRGIKSNIPVNKRNRRSPKTGRPTRFNPSSYGLRGTVERFFGWLKSSFRRLAARYERHNACFVGLIYLACFMIYWRRVFR